MTTKSSKPVGPKPSKNDLRIAGWSAATGGYILRPTSKKGSVSDKAVSAAVKSVISKKKSV
jgi:hypothetical protein